MVPPVIRAVIFDMDGLMLDTESIVRVVWKKAGEDLGIALTDAQFATFIGRPSADTDGIMQDLLGSAEVHAQFKKRVTHHWNTHVAAHGIARKPGLVELLDFLHTRPVKKAVATSTRREYALPKIGDLLPYFDAIVTGDEVRNGKPAPDIFLLAAQRLGLPASDCLVLEDSHAGVDGARAAGSYVIMVPDLLPPRDEHVHVCASLHDVRLWLQNRL